MDRIGKIRFCLKIVRAFQAAPARLIGSRPSRRVGAVRWAPRAIAGCGGSTPYARARSAYATDLPWALTRAAPAPERGQTRCAGRATSTTVISAQRVSSVVHPSDGRIPLCAAQHSFLSRTSALAFPCASGINRPPPGAAGRPRPELGIPKRIQRSPVSARRNGLRGRRTDDSLAHVAQQQPPGASPGYSHTG